MQVEAFSGLETETARKSLDLSGKSKSEVVLPLKRFHHAANDGWHSGNTHLHLNRLTRAQADEYLKNVSRADDLELVFVSYLRRINADRNYISNTYSEQDLYRLSGGGVQFGHGEEMRHNFGTGGEGYGHVMFLNIKQLIQPVSIGPGIMGGGNDAPTLRRGIEQGRSDAATVIWCHNAFGFEDVPDWVAGKLDALNIFDGGSRGGYEDTFYRYLNIGLRVPFSTGTDWFIYDFSRVYVQLDKPPTVENWLSALTAGKTFISNGPLLELHLGEHNIGDTIRLDQSSRLEVRAHGASREDFQQLELVQNGLVVQRVTSHPAGEHFEADMTTAIEANEPGWIALRVSNGGAITHTNEMGAPLFAHTSPVYIEFTGRSVFKLEAARELIAEMERSIRSIESKAQFADDHERDEVFSVYREGIETLRRRLNQ
ncbi:MAG: CehA/McbA family metallohydrolase [Verrucomicrobia bacterium]|nr:CehA/McbA family metallohydrolase [Verrucomicrobiota bacterium]